MVTRCRVKCLRQVDELRRAAGVDHVDAALQDRAREAYSRVAVSGETAKRSLPHQYHQCSVEEAIVVRASLPSSEVGSLGRR